MSPPLESSQPITAKFPFTVPDPPGQPRVVDWDSDSATLTWDRPFSDGGAKIQGYKVEFRDVAEDKDWRSANDYLVKDTNSTVHNLIQGHEYEFRVSHRHFTPSFPKMHIF